MVASVASMIDQFNMSNIEILQKLGYQVDIACNFEFGSSTSAERVNKFQDELIEKGVNSYNIIIPRKLTKVKELLIAYRDVKKLLSQNHYEIVHCHSPIGGVITRLASIKSRKNGTKVIYTAHGFHFFKGAPIINWLTFYPIEKICAQFTDCLITINNEDYQRAVDNKFLAKKIEYVPGIGIDTSNQKNLEFDKNIKKAEFEIKDEPILISVGELNGNKNHEVIIKAISKINLPLKYIICGKGEKLDYLKDLAKNLGVQDRVIFTGYRSDVADLLKMSDIFCLPSYREGLSVALMEAMSSGLAVVCSNIRGNIDLVEQGKGGYLSAPNDFNSLSEAIYQIMTNDKLRAQMGNYNIDKIKMFDKNIVRTKMTDIYSELRGR